MDTFRLVRKVLEAPTFLAQTTDQQQVILKILEETGEVSKEDIAKIIQEQLEKEKSDQEVVKIGQFLNGLDYNTFLTFILSTEIRGQHLITLCNSSKKLNEYCNRAFQVENVKGGIIGESQDQYLFRLLLNRMRIPIPKGRTPRQTYIDKTIGGKVWGFGYNTFEQAGIRLPEQSFSGHSFYNIITTPTIVPDLDNIIQVSNGDYNFLCLDNQGRVWGCGNNSHGQLGLGDEELIERHGLTLNPYLKDIIQVSTSDCSLCLDKYGQVWSFGLNETGALGLGDAENRDVPTIIPTLKNIIQVSTGEGHSLCLDNQGHVWAFGYDESGQLGLGKDILQDVQESPVKIPNLNDIVQISAGGQHSLCLDNQGIVWTFGDNQDGQLGIDYYGFQPSPTLIPDFDNIVQISAGQNHSLCLDNQGRVWGFGSNQLGKLGLSVEEGSYIPVLISGLNNIIEISAGRDHSLCLDSQGRVWEFGFNGDGQLAIGSKINVINIPTINPTLKNIFQISANGSSLCLGHL